METGTIEDNTIVLSPSDGVGDLELVFAGMRPVVVVTTATLHSNCIASPNLNNPIRLVSSTSAFAQAFTTSAFICTRPLRHEVEQTCPLFVKSDTVHPFICVVYTFSQSAGKPDRLGLKSERETAWHSAANGNKARAVDLRVGMVDVVRVARCCFAFSLAR